MERRRDHCPIALIKNGTGSPSTEMIAFITYLENAAVSETDRPRIACYGPRLVLELLHPPQFVKYQAATTLVKLQ